MYRLLAEGLAPDAIAERLEGGAGGWCHPAVPAVALATRAPHRLRAGCPGK